MSAPTSNPPPSTFRSILSVYPVHVVAAACAIVPSYYGYVLKSAQQMRDPIPSMNFNTVVKGGVRAAPNIGFTVATQLAVQNFAEQAFKSKSSDSSLGLMIFGSAIAGTVCSPLLAAFNGQTMNRPFFESIRRTSMRQASVISFRETCFIASLKINDPLCERAKKQFGDKAVVEYGSAFVSGSLGSIVSHPADTALSYMQRGAEMRLCHVMRGVVARTLATGVYLIAYKAIEDPLKPESN